MIPKMDRFENVKFWSNDDGDNLISTHVSTNMHMFRCNARLSNYVYFNASKQK